MVHGIGSDISIFFLCFIRFLPRFLVHTHTHFHIDLVYYLNPAKCFISIFIYVGVMSLVDWVSGYMCCIQHTTQPFSSNFRFTPFRIACCFRNIAKQRQQKESKWLQTSRNIILKSKAMAKWHETKHDIHIAAWIQEEAVPTKKQL